MIARAIIGGMEDDSVDPGTAVLVDRVVAAYRGLNERLGWIDDPASHDAFIREIVRFHFVHNVRQRAEAWDGAGLGPMAEALQAELMEELTEPWPLRALDHPPGQRTPPEPEVVIEGVIARVAFGPVVTDPIELPR